ncbi:EB1 homolog, putative [Babesia caballi]|uniref:EB1 homolog, putative n=1 Tax=Babesia caballi TaxID=5871 RepID=A0AAV4LRD1_BABCB|nr:EB1 homolog, putative [Babesia caballi]
MSPHRGVEPSPLVGRSELIAWVNTALGVSIDRIEQCCNGAIYIQLMDLVHPGRVPLARVKFNAALEYEYLANYKVLQGVFTRLGVSKHIDVQKLTRGRYQDNLEFLQWMRSYVDSQRTVETSEYDGVRRRVIAVIRNCIANNSKAHLTLGSVASALPPWAQDGVTVPLIKECLAHVKSTAAAPSQDSARQPENGNGVPLSRRSSSDTKSVVRGIKTGPTSASTQEAKSRKVDPAFSNRGQPCNASARSTTAETHLKDSDSVGPILRSDSAETVVPAKDLEVQAERRRNIELESLLVAQRQRTEALTMTLDERDRSIAALQQQLEKQKEQLASVKKQLGQAQAERQVAKMSKEFYYNKLRRIEILCQKSTSGQLQVDPLFEIMYSTDNVS